MVGQQSHIAITAQEKYVTPASQISWANCGIIQVHRAGIVASRTVAPTSLERGSKLRGKLSACVRGWLKRFQQESLVTRLGQQVPFHLWHSPARVPVALHRGHRPWNHLDTR